jgi:hypothetical protein
MRPNRLAADDRYGRSDAPREWRCADLFPRAECSPVRHDLDQSVIGQAPQCLDDGVPGHAVMLRQLGHSRQPLARLRFPRRCTAGAGSRRRVPERPWPPQYLVQHVHAVDELPADHPVLALPAHQARLAARAPPAPHGSGGLAGPPLRRLNQAAGIPVEEPCIGLLSRKIRY